MAGTVIFYSGAESKEYYGLIKKYSQNALVSFYYIKKNKDIIRQRFEADGTHWFIDSGAYTLRNETGVDFSVTQWEAYLEEYAEWLSQNKKYIYAAVELDVGNQVGFPVIDVWRRKYFEPLELQGVQVLYVWHTEQSMQALVDACKKYRYVGLTHATMEQKTTQKCMRIAKKYRAKVHGFAITSGHALRSFGMATADSTTWVMGVKFASWRIFTGDHMTSVDRPRWAEWKNHIIQAGFDYNAMINMDRREVSAFCLSEFVKMEETFRAVKKGIDYWRVRAPYPDVVANMLATDVSAWVASLDVGGTEHSDRDVLMAVSLLQNSRLGTYMTHSQKYDQVLTDALGIIVNITDDISLDGVRDDFNNRFNVREPVKKREREDDEVVADRIARERPEDWAGEIAEADESEPQDESS